MRIALYGILAGSLAAVGCGSSTAPSSPAEVVRSVRVSGQTLSVGDTAQFTATATMGDESTHDVTPQAKWSTSDATLASVSPTGLVNAVKDGAVDIRATYQNKSGTAHLTVRPLRFFGVTGVVTEAPPGFNAVVGARVEVVEGANKGQAASTDGNGYYAMPGLREGTFTVAVSRDGYQDVSKSVTISGADKRVDMLIYPVPPSGATARCKDKSWSYTLDRNAACLPRNGGVSYFVCPGPLCQS